MNYCEKCMRPLEDGGICPVCGILSPAPVHHIRPGTMLRRKFVVGRAFSEDAMVISYLGRDLTQDRVVVVQEFFPAGQVIRNHTQSNTVEEAHFQEKALERFLEKAKVLMDFASDPHVLQVLDYFRDNNTAYMVTEYAGGISLQTYLQKKGPVPAASLLELMKPVLQVLGKLHQAGLIHRKIAPENVKLYPDGNIKLVNFGLTQSSETLNHGYAPLEQYQGGECGPWSDVYSLCAVLYHSITGICPQPAVERESNDLLLRPSHLGVAIEEKWETALMLGLGVRTEQRLQAVDALMRVMGMIEEAPAVVVVSMEGSKPEQMSLTGMPVLEGVDETAERPIDPVEHHGRPSQNLSVYVQPRAELMEQPEEEPDLDKTRINIPGMPKFTEEPAQAEEPKPQLPQFLKPKEEKAQLPQFLKSKEEKAPLPQFLKPKEEAPEQPVVPAAPAEPAFNAMEDERTWYAPMEYDRVPADYTEPAPISYAPPAAREELKPKRKKGLLIGIIAGLLVLLLAVAACLYFFTDIFGGKKGGEEETTELAFTLDGEEYTLPMKLSALMDDGWSAMTWLMDNGGDQFGLEDALKAGGMVHGIMEKEEQEIWIFVYNSGEEEQPVQECDIVYLRVAGDEADLEVGGITTDATLEEAEEALDGKNEDGYVVCETDGGTIALHLENEDPEANQIVICTKEYQENEIE